MQVTTSFYYNVKASQLYDHKEFWQAKGYEVETRYRGDVVRIFIKAMSNKKK